MIKRLVIAVVVLLAANSVASTADPALRFAAKENEVEIRLGEQPLMTYVFRDDTILRPYFTRVHAPGGVQVTRTNPPVEGIDPTDHATMHPGIWLAFGDLGGTDFWRNKGSVKHVKFVEPPIAESKNGRFTVSNQYRSGERLVCEENCRVTIETRAAGYLLTLDSTFSGPEPFAFGDQEEMGLGVRVATPLSVKKGGRIRNADGLMNEKEVWGKTSDWCEYGGMIGGRRAGVVLMPHPGNFRPSWFHARDYGLLVANPFGRNAFTKGEKSRVEVRPGESLRLRFGIFIHSTPGDASPNFAEEYRAYLTTSK